MDHRMLAETGDYELMQAYARGRSQEAFAELARRYAPLVYSAAVRQVRDRHAAEDVTQGVFVLLAQKAGRLGREVVLPAWLLVATRNKALDWTKGEARRRRRERKAGATMAPQVENPPPPDDWERIRPVLDEAVAGLNERNRAALVLSYFEGKTSEEVGARLGISAEAARQRVSRALDELRRVMAGKGVSLPAAAIGSAIAANAVGAAPAAVVVSAAAAGATAGGGGITGGLIMAVAAKANIGALIVAAVVLLATAGLIWWGMTGPQKHARVQSVQIAPPVAQPPAAPADPSLVGPVVSGVVRDATGKPRPDARVIVATPTDNLAVPQAINDASRGYRTNADGTFSVPDPGQDFALAAVTDDGWAFVRANGRGGQKIDLVVQAWARVEGVVMEGDQPVSGATVILGSSGFGRPNPAWFVNHERTVRTDAAGRFAFNKVAPGAAWVARRHRGRSQKQFNTPYQGLDLAPGATTQVQLGGTGRPVAGRVAAPGAADPFDFMGTLMRVGAERPAGWEEMAAPDRVDWARGWFGTPAGSRSAQVDHPIYFEAEPDGAFRVQDVPAGTYLLSFKAMTQEGPQSPPEVVAHADRVVVVPDGPMTAAVDVGSVEAVTKLRMAPGTAAPDIVATGPDGAEVKLSSFKGKHVLLILWSPERMTHDLRSLNVVRELYRGDERLVTLSLRLGGDPAAVPPAPAGFVQATVDPAKVPPEYLAAEAMVFMIDPEGAIAARNLKGRSVYGAVDAALRGTADPKVKHAWHSAARSGEAFDDLKHVPAPAVDDLGKSAVWTAVDGGMRQMNLAALSDGLLPDNKDEPARNVAFGFFTLQGRLRADLGRVATVRRINSYSWHKDVRGPQLYRVYGSDGTAAGFNADPKVGTDPAGVGWTFIAKVDTRPDGSAHGGMYGAMIADPEGKPLGQFRYLLLVAFATEVKTDFGQTFYSEIDVVGE